MWGVMRSILCSSVSAIMLYANSTTASSTTTTASPTNANANAGASSSVSSRLLEMDDNYQPRGRNASSVSNSVYSLS